MKILALLAAALLGAEQRGGVRRDCEERRRPLGRCGEGRGTEGGLTSPLRYNSRVRRVSRYIATSLLAVLLTTLLAPGFGWEASAGQAEHGHAVAALGEDDHGSEGAGDRGGEESYHHHGCAGHMFGHLSALLDEAVGLALPDADDATGSQRLPGVVTSFLKRLDRPPHAPDLA